MYAEKLLLENWDYQQVFFPKHLQISEYWNQSPLPYRLIIDNTKPSYVEAIGLANSTRIRISEFTLT